MSRCRSARGGFGTARLRAPASSPPRYWRRGAQLDYTLGSFSSALPWRRLPSVRNASYVTDPQTSFAGAAAYNVYNLAGIWRAKAGLTLTVGIDNLFNRDPNAVGAGPNTDGAGTTVPGYYDVLGRRYYLDVRWER